MKTLTFFFLFLFPLQHQLISIYPWQKTVDPVNTLLSRIPTPQGYTRTVEAPGSFGTWLRGLPLKTPGAQVHLYDGRLKRNQQAQFAVLDVDVGTTDLQQCADAVIRMRAEYLYFKKNYRALHFNFTSGDKAEYSKWIQGYRPRIAGNKVSWQKVAVAGDSYEIFKTYLKTVFTFAGTSSLSKELHPAELKDFRIGDVFITGGFPGHAVLIADICENKTTGKKLFLLQQSYMPAQEIHILRNPSNAALSPWYEADFEGDLVTPEWVFTGNKLMQWSED